MINMKRMGALALRRDFRTEETNYIGNSSTGTGEIVKQRAKAEASSSETSGRWTTSVMPAAIKGSAPIWSADAVASRIGTSGTISCSAAARSSADLAEVSRPTSNASNLFGLDRHAASASSERVNPTGS